MLVSIGRQTHLPVDPSDPSVLLDVAVGTQILEIRPHYDELNLDTPVIPVLGNLYAVQSSPVPMQVLDSFRELPFHVRATHLEKEFAPLAGHSHFYLAPYTDAVITDPDTHPLELRTFSDSEESGSEEDENKESRVGRANDTAAQEEDEGVQLRVEPREWLLTVHELFDHFQLGRNPHLDLRASNPLVQELKENRAHVYGVVVAKGSPVYFHKPKDIAQSFSAKPPGLQTTSGGAGSTPSQIKDPYFFEFLLASHVPRDPPTEDKAAAVRILKVTVWNSLVQQYFQAVEVGQTVAVHGFRVARNQEALRDNLQAQSIELMLNPGQGVIELVGECLSCISSHLLRLSSKPLFLSFFSGLIGLLFCSMLPIPQQSMNVVKRNYIASTASFG